MICIGCVEMNQNMYEKWNSYVDHCFMFVVLLIEFDTVIAVEKLVCLITKT